MRSGHWSCLSSSWLLIDCLLDEDDGIGEVQMYDYVLEQHGPWAQEDRSKDGPGI